MLETFEVREEVAVLYLSVSVSANGSASCGGIVSGCSSCIFSGTCKFLIYIIFL